MLICYQNWIFALAWAGCGVSNAHMGSAYLQTAYILREHALSAKAAMSQCGR